MHLDRRLLGWGLFFILLGSVPLLVRAGALDETLVGRWPTLWPLVLIAWGLGMIFQRTPLSWLGGAVLIVTLGVMGGGALTTGQSGVSGLTGCGTDGRSSPFATQSGTVGAESQLIVEFSCGSLSLAAADGSEWSVSGSDRDGRGPEVTSTGSRVTMRSPESQGFFNAVDGSNTWQVTVPRATSFGLGVTLNAGDGSLDLSGASLSSMNFTVNAGSLDIALSGASQVGSVNGTVNAGSASIDLPRQALRVNLSLNAGSLDVCVPPDLPVRVQWSGALGSNDLEQAGLVEVDDDTWQTPGFDASQAHAALNVSANAGSFSLQGLEGACGA